MSRIQGLGGALHVPGYDISADDNAFRREKEEVIRCMVLFHLVSNPGTKCNTSYFTRPRKKNSPGERVSREGLFHVTRKTGREALGHSKYRSFVRSDRL